jgi:RecT family protein
MTDTTTQEHPQSQTPPPQQPAQPERVTRRDLVEGNAEKVVNERTEGVTLFKGGGVDYANLRDMVDAAKLLAASGPYLPPFMQGNVGACFANCMRAQELGVSPLALAKWTYVVEQWVGGQKVEQIAYESQMFHAVVEARAPITTRLQTGYEGSGKARKCRVWATFRGETEPRYFPPLDADPDQFTLGKLHPGHNEKGRVKGSPLWDTKPDLQLFYNMSRDWARMYCPDVISGMYGRDEMEDAGFTVASDAARDVSPGLASRLRGTPSSLGQAAIAAIDAQAAETSKPKVKSERAAPSPSPSAESSGSDFPGDRPLPTSDNTE